MTDARNEVSAVVVRAAQPAAGVNASDPSLLETRTEVDKYEFEGVLPLKNISYLGRCYDLRRLDLLDPGERARDGGGCMGTFAIEIPLAKCNVPSSDRTVLIPQGTNYRAESRGALSTRTLVWETTDAFITSLQGTVTEQHAVPKAGAYHASGSYRDVLKSTEFHRQAVTFVQGSFVFCGVRLQDDFDASLGLDSAFVAAVKGLKKEADCAGFIQDFGTHYAREVTFGGRMYQRIHITQEARSLLMESGRSLESCAEATYQKAVIENSRRVASVFNSALQSGSGINVEELRWVGGTPNTNFDKWAKTVRDDPKPLQLDLEPLHNLFTEKHFPGSNITQKKQWMEKAVNDYVAALPPVDDTPSSKDLSDLDGKQYYLLNRKGAESNDPRVGQQLGILSWDVKLSSGDEKFPWKLKLVPGKTDEFDIQGHGAGSGGSPTSAGNMLGFYTNSFLTVAKLKTPFPWKLVPVPGKTNEYYIWCATEGKGSQYLWARVGFDDQGLLKLYSEEEKDQLVPWELKPVAS